MRGWRNPRESGRSKWDTLVTIYWTILTCAALFGYWLVGSTLF